MTEGNNRKKSRIAQEKSWREDRGFLILTVLTAAVLFGLCLAAAMFLDYTKTPDEIMRMRIPRFIYEHGYLPNGDEPELLEGFPFGFSYGYSPYLPSLVSVVFMKIASLFQAGEYGLLVAARMVNVLSGVGIFVVCILLGMRLFDKKAKAYLFACLCAFLPQLIFLSGYLNNDSPSVFATALVALFWVSGMERRWDKVSCVKLGVSLGILALTYYNAYGFILMSIVIFCVSCYKMRGGLRQMLLRGILVFCVAMLVGGWFFVRNPVIHDGDFIGMKTMYESGEKYGAEEWKMSNRKTPQNEGKTLYETFFEEYLPEDNWFGYTAKSFVGIFGAMQYHLSQNTYIFYFVFLIGFGGFGLLAALVRQVRSGTWQSGILLLSFIACMIIPFFLSMYYTYTIDYQSQGRYVISIVIPVMYFVVNGIQKMTQLLRIRGKGETAVYALITCVWLGFTMYAYFFVLVPTCFSAGAGL